MGEQLADQVVELGDAGPARHVGGDGGHGLAAQDVLDEGGQVAARPGLDKKPRPIGVHGLHQARKLHRRGPVSQGQLAHGGGIIGKPLSRGAAVDRHPGAWNSA